MLPASVEASGSARDTLSVQADFKTTNLGKVMTLFEDMAGNLTLPQILANPNEYPFHKHPDQVPNQGYTDSVYWVRFSLYNPNSETFDGVVEVPYAPLDQIEFYDGSNPAGPPKRAGDSLPFSVRDIQYHKVAFFLAVEPQETSDFYLRVKTSSSMQIPVVLWSQRAFVAESSGTLLFWGLYFGALFVAAGYNLFLFSSLHDRVYGYYVAFVVSVGFFQACVQGFASQYLWPSYPTVTNSALLVALNAMGVASVPFSIRFLRLRYYLPQAEKLLLVIAGIMSIHIMFGWLFAYSVVLKFSIVLFALGAILLIVAGAYCWFQGYTPARLYLVSWLIMLLGAFVFSLKTMGYIEPTPFSNHAVTIGSALEIFLLSLAIADRVSLERAQRREAQDKNLDMQKKLLAANQLALQNAQQADRLKQEFLSTMSHELRTPLNGVLGCAQLLEVENDRSRQKQTLGYLKSSANQILGQVNRLLNFSQLHAGTIPIENEVFSLHEMISEINAMASSSCEERGLDFALSAPERDVCLRSDRAKIYLVINDLLDNAIKFTSSGRISLTVDVTAAGCDEKTGPAQLKCIITDTGQGIEEKYQKQLFTMFSQQDSSFKRSHEGLGLGLAICERYVALLGGNIRVESEWGKGAKFSFELPVEIEELIEKAMSQTMANGQLQGARVLVVEDNPTNQIVLQKMLSRLGCVSELAVNGKRALEMLHADNAFDIILMDCHMPLMDGFSATREIRKLPGEISGIPILAVTANAAAGDRSKCLDAGMDDYLAKPFSMDELSHKLGGLLAGASFASLKSAGKVGPGTC